MLETNTEILCVTKFYCANFSLTEIWNFGGFTVYHVYLWLWRKLWFFRVPMLHYIVSAVDCTILTPWLHNQHASMLDLANENSDLWRCAHWNEFDWFMIMRVLILPFKLFDIISPGSSWNHGGRVVKALDLRSNGRMSAWVRTPPVVDLFNLWA